MEETSKTFKVAVSTIRKWEKQLKEKGDLKPKVPVRGSKKIEPDKLHCVDKSAARIHAGMALHAEMLLRANM